MEPNHNPIRSSAQYTFIKIGAAQRFSPASPTSLVFLETLTKLEVGLTSFKKMEVFDPSTISCQWFIYQWGRVKFGVFLILEM
jgi:hypothetical protein